MSSNPACPRKTTVACGAPLDGGHHAPGLGQEGVLQGLGQLGPVFAATGAFEVDPVFPPSRRVVASLGAEDQGLAGAHAGGEPFDVPEFGGGVGRILADVVEPQAFTGDVEERVPLEFGRSDGVTATIHVAEHDLHQPEGVTGAGMAGEEELRPRGQGVEGEREFEADEEADGPGHQFHVLAGEQVVGPDPERPVHEPAETASHPHREEGEEAEDLGHTEGECDPDQPAETHSPPVDDEVDDGRHEMDERRGHGEDQRDREHDRCDDETSDPTRG